MCAAELGLSDHHQQNLIEYLKFCRLQRQAQINMVLSHFDNTRKQKLHDETYTKDELVKLLMELKEIIGCELENELINVSHMNLLLFRQLSAQAEKHHVNLFINIFELEDRQLLDAVSCFETEHFTKKNVAKTATILQKLVAIEGISQEQPLRENDETARIREELEKCQSEVTRLQSAGKDDRIKQQMLIEKIETTEQRLLGIKQQLELKELELERKFANTNTYKTMEHILKRKNKTIKQLRALLDANDISALPDECCEEVATSVDED